MIRKHKDFFFQINIELYPVKSANIAIKNHTRYNHNRLPYKVKKKKSNIPWYIASTHMQARDPLLTLGTKKQKNKIIHKARRRIVRELISC